MLERLVRLYPREWRERYGDELEQLVRDIGPERKMALDLVKGALVVHLRLEQSDRSALRKAAAVAGVVWLGLSVEVVLTNVVFPARTDDDALPVLLSYLCVFAALFGVGLLAARAGAGRVGQVLAGVLAGTLIGALTVGTFAVVDNVWLDIVARQQSKIDGLAESGGGSMRGYINHGLIGAALVLTIGLAAFGAALSWIGGALREFRR